MPKKVNLIGMKFGRLSVIKESEKRDGSGNVYWETKCDCGTEKTVAGRLLRNGDIVSCGCYHKEEVSKRMLNDLTGKRFGFLSVICLNSVNKDGAYWLCLCDCGKSKIIRQGSLVSGATKTCGCSHHREKHEDLTGKIFGSYLAVKKFSTVRFERNTRDDVYEPLWECKCLNCGEIVYKTARVLKHGRSETCIGHMKSESLEYRALKQGIRNRRVRKATPLWADLDAIEKIYKQRKLGEHVDHIIPLKGKNVSGLHVAENLRIIPASENLKKRNKLLL
jgi:hypothetical protein